MRKWNNTKCLFVKLRYSTYTYYVLFLPLIELADKYTDCPGSKINESKQICGTHRHCIARGGTNAKCFLVKRGLTVILTTQPHR